MSILNFLQLASAADTIVHSKSLNFYTIIYEVTEGTAATDAKTHEILNEITIDETGDTKVYTAEFADVSYIASEKMELSLIDYPVTLVGKIDKKIVTTVGIKSIKNDGTIVIESTDKGKYLFLSASAGVYGNIVFANVESEFEKEFELAGISYFGSAFASKDYMYVEKLPGELTATIGSATLTQTDKNLKVTANSSYMFVNANPTLAATEEKPSSLGTATPLQYSMVNKRVVTALGPVSTSNTDIAGHVLADLVFYRRAVDEKGDITTEFNMFSTPGFEEVHVLFDSLKVVHTAQSKSSMIWVDFLGSYAEAKDYGEKPDWLTNKGAGTAATYVFLAAGSGSNLFLIIGIVIGVVVLMGILYLYMASNKETVESQSNESSSSDL